MKVFAFCTVTAIFLCLSLTVSVSAEASPLPEEVLGGYETMLDAVPDGLRETLPEGMLSGDSAEISDAIQGMLDPAYLFGVISSAVGLYLDDSLRLLSTLGGILILSAVFGVVRKSFRSDAPLGKTVSTVMSMALLLAVAETQTALFSQLRDYFGGLTTLASGMIPLSAVLYAMGGNVAGAANGSTGMSLFLAIAECASGKLLFPTVSACMALATVPVFAPSVRLKSLSAAIKRVFTFSLGFLMMLLSATLAMRSNLASKADSVSARTVKYVASSVIPVVGGSVADSLRTVGASVEYLRTTLGLAGILLIILLLLPVLVNLLLTRFVLILSASVAEMLGCDGEGRLLSELVGVYGYILAVAVMCAVMFIFALTLLVRTAAAV